MMMKKFNNKNTKKTNFDLLHLAENSLCLRDQEIEGYLNERLDWLELIRVKLHLGECFECQERLAWYEEVFDISEYEYPPGLGEKIQNILNLKSVSLPEVQKKSKERIQVGILSWRSVALYSAADAESVSKTEHVEYLTNEHFSVNTINDSDRNLILRFVLPNSLIKDKQKIVLKNNTLLETGDLKREGKRWFAEIVIEKKKRQDIAMNQDDIAIDIES